jgi:5-methyltetrahydropteroyltriglutamate--homocysteine methyltransferase
MRVKAPRSPSSRSTRWRRPGIIPLESLGATDDCGFSPFADDTSTSRETAFAKIRSRLEGTAMAESGK